MSDWINLDIGNIPSDFFVNERYEIQYYIEETCATHDYWGECTNKPYERYTYIECVVEKNIQYRYRLKPLEPIRITRELAAFLWDEADKMELEAYCDHVVFDNDNQLIECDGRPVEIIKE